MSESGGSLTPRSLSALKYPYHPERDPFLCTCGPCKKFWRDTFSEGGDLLKEPAVQRSRDTAVLSPNSKAVKVGDRVIVHGRHAGTVKWVGVLHEDTIAPELYVGVRLDDNINSTHNGVYNGKRYFHVPRGHGAMVKYTDVLPIKAPTKRPPLTGNYMFPSWDEVQRRRKDRNDKLQSIYASAGITSPLGNEPYAYSPSRAFPSLPSSRSASPVKPMRSEPIIHVSDPHDIALRDIRRKREKLGKRHVSLLDKEQKEMDRLRQKFGQGPEADRLALTLRKLKSAFQEGQALVKQKGGLDIRSLSDDTDY